MCNCNKNFHCITNTTYTPNTSLVLTMSNTNNISNRARFNFIVNKCISNVVTGAPVQVYITGINGKGAIPVYTKFGALYPLYSDLLSKYYTRFCRCNNESAVLHGDYVSVGVTSYVILNDVPRCNCANVTGGAERVTPAVATTEGTNE